MNNRIFAVCNQNKELSSGEITQGMNDLCNGCNAPCPFRTIDKINSRRADQQHALPLSKELEIALISSGRYLKVQLPALIGLNLEQIQAAVLSNVFPAASCDPIWGPSWDRAEVDAWILLRVK